MLSQNNNLPVTNSVGDIRYLRELILAAKQGDKLAFEQVYELLFTPLYRYVFSRCRESELAQDICQQAFLKFYQALANYEPDKSPLAYLFTIAKHLLINHHEKKKSVSFDETLFETVGDESIDIVDKSHIRLLADQINEYLPELTKDEEDVIRMYFYAELEYKEIANILEKEEASVRKIKERALKKLRALTYHLYEGNH